MHHFFADPTQVAEDTIFITGPDVNHMKHVLRMKPGEEVLISDGTGRDYTCEVEAFEPDRAVVRIHSVCDSRMELPAEIWLFRGLPKADKMELIIQKAVELGACQVIPVETKRCVVRLDGKKAAKKVERWQQIAESAAKQSKRMLIPSVHPVMTFKDALAWAKEMDVRLIPYELAQGIAETKALLSEIRPGQSIGIFIGPEGGFEEKEIEAAIDAGVSTITLGKRILRTETAGLAILSVLMFQLEQ